MRVVRLGWAAAWWRRMFGAVYLYLVDLTCWLRVEDDISAALRPGNSGVELQRLCTGAWN
jgi:hypothetical protein